MGCRPEDLDHHTVHVARNAARDNTLAESQRRGYYLSEHDLIIAIINRAQSDLIDPDPEIRKSAANWFMSGDKRPFSYHWCLEMINVENPLGKSITNYAWSKELNESDYGNN